MRGSWSEESFVPALCSELTAMELFDAIPFIAVLK
jgi:hypothetical protein